MLIHSKPRSLVPVTSISSYRRVGFSSRSVCSLQRWFIMIVWLRDWSYVRLLFHAPLLTAQVNRTTFLRQRSDGLFAGQDDPEPLNYVGLEFPQKQTSVSATVNSFTTHFMLFWKLNLCSQIDGVRGIKCDCLRKLAAHCCLCTAISLCCCHSDW